MDVTTIIALGGAIAFVAFFLYYQKAAKPVAKAIVGFTEAELAALSSGKKPKKKAAPKDKKAVSPKVEKKVDAKPAPSGARRLKNVDGAADHDTDEEMLSFLSNKITLETKRKNAETEAEEEKPKSKKGPKEPVVTEKPAAGFTAVVEKKKPAKKETEETAVEEKKEESEKKRVKSFFKADADEEKRAAEARKAEWEQRKKEKETGVRAPRPPRDPNAPRPPPRPRAEEGSTEEGGAPARPPRQYAPMATPTHTDMFEEWSIDSLLDSITAAPAEKQVKRAPRAATATATATSDEPAAADAAQE